MARSGLPTDDTIMLAAQLKMAEDTITAEILNDALENRPKNTKKCFTPKQEEFVRFDLFSDITNHLLEQLQGPDLTLKRVNDESLIGDRNSLYYQRYMILNQRMNKSSGELYHVTNLERSSTVLNFCILYVPKKNLIKKSF